MTASATRRVASATLYLLAMTITAVLIHTVSVTQAQSRLTQQIFDTSYDGVLICDESAHIIYANESATRITGFPTASLIGSTIQVLVPEEFRNIHKESYMKAIQTMKDSDGQISFHKKFAVPCNTKNSEPVEIYMDIHSSRIGNEYRFIAIFRKAGENYEDFYSMFKSYSELQAEISKKY